MAFYFTRPQMHYCIKGHSGWMFWQRWKKMYCDQRGHSKNSCLALPGIFATLYRCRLKCSFSFIEKMFPCYTALLCSSVTKVYVIMHFIVSFLNITNTVQQVMQVAGVPLFLMDRLCPPHWIPETEKNRKPIVKNPYFTSWFTSRWSWIHFCV